MRVWSSTCVLIGALTLSGCGVDGAADTSGGEGVTADFASPGEERQARDTLSSDALIAAESEKASRFFEDAFMERVRRSPVFQSYLGIKDDYDKWDDSSEAHAREGLAITQRQLEELRSSIDYARLDESTRLSYELFVREAELEIESFQYRHHNYPVNQMRGLQSQAPALLINIHRIADIADAEAYIERLINLEGAFAQLIEGLEVRASKGIIAPRFVFPHVIQDSRNVLQGAPFDDAGEDSTLLADFRAKVQKLDVDPEQRAALIQRAAAALLEQVQPAYEALIAYLLELEQQATTDDGAWKLPDGDAFYHHQLRRRTTTELTPEEIHDIGLAEVARIHEEMRAIMRQVEFEGSLQEFFQFLREDERFYYPQSEEGRQAYLDEAVRVIDTMKSRLDELFLTKPRADLIVKRVEPFREASAGKAFYQRPAPDGSRPGTYYANLYRMADMPRYQLEALAYHEGIPGHHMQLAIALELEGLPQFRKWAFYTAYTEGWGLYSELLPKEIGMYSDPYSDFGRLAMELWRACRLVVDTGVHAKRWTREKAIAYLDENTPNPHGDVVKAIERYIVTPGQATAYKIGMIKLLELREKARERLGERFDIREFHDVVLRNGPLPLTVLESMVERYIDQHKG